MDSMESRLAEEIQFHIDQEIARNIQHGMTPADARRAAIKKFGMPEAARERARDEFRFARVRECARDLRLVARRLRRSPGFTAVAVLTLALGIGATTAVFSVVYGVVLKPLPFTDPDRLVALHHVTPALDRDLQGDATYFMYREQGRAFEDIGLWSIGNISVTRNDGPEQVRVLRVTDGVLPLLGVRPETGRLIDKDDDRPGAPLRVVLTHAYWTEAFGGSIDVLSRPMTIDARPYEIIGILPATFRFLDTDPRVVMPLRLNRANARTGPLGFNGIGRLKRGMTIADANADITRMIPLLPAHFPLMPGLSQQMWDSVRLAPNVRPLEESVIGEMRRPLWIVLGTVTVVLLIAWTNVASLLLVRAEGRQREFAVRGALGASRGRIAVELLAESLMLGLAGGAAGLAVAKAAILLLKWLAPVALPRVGEIGLDAVVLGVTVATSIMTSLLFGLIPVVQFRVFDLGALKEAGRSMTGSPRRHRKQSAFVVAQVSLALVLLVVSALMGRTFVAMRQVQPGFVGPKQVQTFSISLPASLVRDRAQVPHTYEQIASRLRQVPGVESVGVGFFNMSAVGGRAPVYVEGRHVEGMPPVRLVRSVGAGYFETLGNPIVAGRAMTWNDIFDLKRYVLISDNLARELWGAPERAIGQRIGLFADGPWDEVIGVVGNERANGLNHPAPALAYYPLADADNVSRSMTYVVRSDRAGAPGFLRELQQAVWSVMPSVPLATPRTLEDLQAASMSQTSFAMVMLALAAGVALLLALVGIYGVVSHIATERTHEVGVRMALGAQRGDVLRLFLRHGLALTTIGVLLGLGATVLLTPLMSSLLYGVGATDPATYVVVSAALAAVTLLATYLPARRASGIAPISALRSGH